MAKYTKGLTKKISLLTLTLTLLLVTGCQNYKEVQNALLTGSETYAFESQAMITMKLELNEAVLAKLNKEEQQRYRTFQEVSLTLANYIRVGRHKESIIGALEYGETMIPFHFERNGDESILLIEGAKLPIYFNADTGFKWTDIEVSEAEIGPAPTGISREKKAEWSPYFSGVAGAWLPQGTMIFKSSDYDKWRNARIDQVRVQKRKALRDKGQLKAPGYGQWIVDLKNTLEQARSAYENMTVYFVQNTPLPQTSSVDEAVIEINGKQERLKRLRVQADGSGLAEMLFGLFQSLSKEEKALREIAAALYDISTASSLARLERLRETDPDSAEVASLQSYLGDHEVMVNTLYQQLKSIIDESLASANTENSTSGNEPSILERAELAFELYYQGSNGRAASMQFYLPLPSSNDSPIKGVLLTYAMNRWNMNQEIPLKTVNISKGKLDYYQKDGSYAFATPYELLAFFDPKSDAYKLLEALNVDGVDVDFPVSTQSMKEGEKPGTTGSRAYVENGVTMVPLRFVSEQLFADVTWNGEKKQIIIVDPSKDITILLTLGSKTAIVNGKSVLMQIAPMVSPSGKTYVPIRFIAEALGAEVKWDGEARRVGVKRK